MEYEVTQTQAANSYKGEGALGSSIVRQKSIPNSISTLEVKIDSLKEIAYSLGQSLNPILNQVTPSVIEANKNPSHPTELTALIEKQIVQVSDLIEYLIQIKSRLEI